MVHFRFKVKYRWLEKSIIAKYRRLGDTNFRCLSEREIKLKREARQVVQTGERARQTVLDNTFNKSRDIQEREFVLFQKQNLEQFSFCHKR